MSLWLALNLVACQSIQLRSPIKVKEPLQNAKERYAGPGIEKTQWKEDSLTHQNLISLPKPKGRILVSAYGFRDQSGQYKQAPSNGFSTAVSQGANAILIKAVRDSGWFVPIEREALQNLLTERKIIRSGLRGTTGEIPPLLGASILFEGGIIGYDSNIKTGGAGVKYFGLGVAEQYRVDQVTVSLRAIDIYSGKIINTVVVNKSIFSKETTGGFYRFIRFKRLLEMEAGYTRNEPVQLALVDAIETSVLKMVVEGVKLNLWSLANPKDIQHPLILQYSDKSDRPISTRPTTKKKIRSKPTNLKKLKTPGSTNVTNSPSLGEPSNATLPPIPATTPIPKRRSISKRKPTTFISKPTTKSITTSHATTVPVLKVSDAEPITLNHQSSFPLGLLSSSAAAAPSGPYYAIQLVSSKKAMGIVDFITETELNVNELRLINYKHSGVDQYALLYGAYIKKEEALQAIKNLPESIKAHGPWLRIINQNGNRK
ncbi:MAG: hypothetical protein KUG82_10425 [Pseudomonadales bacterium]|nr:hypothetical protein [Pseudomonadales bacterium]